MTPSFFSKIYQEFHAQWPVPSTTAEEIAANDGSQEQAQTIKEKASENVSDSTLFSQYISENQGLPKNISPEG